MKKYIGKRVLLSILTMGVCIFPVSMAEAEDGLADVTPFIPLHPDDAAALEALYNSRGSTQGTYIEQENGHITELEIYHTSYTEPWEFPQQLAALPTLAKLEIDATGLTKPLPSSLFSSTNLKRLTLKMYEYPLQEHFSADSALEDIHFYQCSFEKIPESIENLSSLRSLFVQNSKLTTLPESIGNMQKLEDLDLRDTLLQSLPKSLGNLKSLKRLRVYNSKLTDLPESFSFLPALELAYLAGNNITVLPTNMAGCRALKELDLGFNALGQSDISSLATLPALEKLNLHGNGFSGGIPEMLFALPKLEYLNLSGNNFSGNVPAALMDSGLYALILTNNAELKGEMLPFITGSTSSNLRTLVTYNTGLSYAPMDATFLAAQERKYPKLWEASPSINPAFHLAFSFLPQDIALFDSESMFSSDYVPFTLWGEEVAFTIVIDMAAWIRDINLQKTKGRIQGAIPAMEKAMQQLNAIGKEQLLKAAAEYHIESVLAYSYYGLMEDMGDYPIRTEKDLLPYLKIESVFMEVEEPLENPAIRINVCMEIDEALVGGHQMCVTVENGVVTGGEM